MPTMNDFLLPDVRFSRFECVPTRVSASDPGTRCPSCGHACDPGDGGCGYCGTEFVYTFARRSVRGLVERHVARLREAPFPVKHKDVDRRA